MIYSDGDSKVSKSHNVLKNVGLDTKIHWRKHIRNIVLLRSVGLSARSPRHGLGLIKKVRNKMGEKTVYFLKSKTKSEKRLKPLFFVKLCFFQVTLQFIKDYDVMLLSLSAIQTENVRFMSKHFLMRSSQQSINFHLVPSQYQSVFYHADSPPGWQSSNRLS